MPGFTHYQELYSSRVLYTKEDIRTYLDTVDLLCLTDMARNRLDSPLTLKEIKMTVSSLQILKTPGPDGFPAEFFKHYAEDLLSMHHVMIIKALEEGSLPPMFEAMVLPKPGRDS